MAKSASSIIMMKRNAIMMFIEALAVLVLVLSIVVLVAGRFQSFRTLPILTFDTSSIKAQLASQGVSNLSSVPDWYEPHYLSICKGMWQPVSTNQKNGSSTICTVMEGGYSFSLTKLLTIDAGLSLDYPLLSNWSFATINTKAPFIELAVGIACVSVTIIAYLITIIAIPNLTAASPLLVPRIGYLASIAALIMLIISAAKITSIMDNILDDKAVKENGLAWSNGAFYALTWVAAGLMLVTFILSLVFAFTIPRPMNLAKQGQLRKDSEYSTVY